MDAYMSLNAQILWLSPSNKTKGRINVPWKKAQTWNLALYSAVMAVIVIEGDAYLVTGPEDKYNCFDLELPVNQIQDN